MTCIVAVKIKNEIVIGGDTLGSNGFKKSHLKDCKVFTVGSFTIGYTSSYTMGQILEYLWTPPSRVEGISTKAYLVSRVIPSIRNCFTDHGFNCSSSGVDSGGEFILVYDNEIYKVQDDYAILQPDQPFASVGSGEYHAESCASTLLKHNNKLKLTAEQIVVESIQTASDMVTSVGGEVFTLKIGGK